MVGNIARLYCRIQQLKKIKIGQQFYLFIYLFIIFLLLISVHCGGKRVHLLKLCLRVEWRFLTHSDYQFLIEVQRNTTESSLVCSTKPDRTLAAGW